MYFEHTSKISSEKFNREENLNSQRLKFIKEMNS